jgi:hypothetical protein
MTSLCRLMTTSALFGFISFILPEGASASFLSSEGDENALPNLLSAIPVIDSESFEPGELPRTLRATWQDYQQDRIASFMSGELKIVDPVIYEQKKTWEDLSLEDKQGISAISVMYRQKRTEWYSRGIIGDSEFGSNWEDLSSEVKARLPLAELLPSRVGLAECKAVGCSQFSEGQLAGVIQFIVDHDTEVRAKKLSDKRSISYEDALEIVKSMREADALHTAITVIDHREEPHLHIKGIPATGYSVSGIVYKDSNVGLPMSLYAPGDAFSKGKSNLGAEKTETTLIRGIQTHKVITLISIGDKNYGMIQSGKATSLAVEEAYSERDLAHRLGVGYGRIPITDHCAMEGEDGNFLRLAYDGQSTKSYVIHHCRGGKGRTQTGLTTRDMMRNHDKGLSLTEFVLRQYLIGGTNTFGVLAADPIDDWKMPRAFERAQAITNFYHYAHHSPQGVRTMYDDWLSTR